MSYKMYKALSIKNLYIFSTQGGTRTHNSLILSQVRLPIAPPKYVLFKPFEPQVGFEPTTCSLQVSCSTIEPLGQNKQTTIIIFTHILILFNCCVSP